MDGSSGQVTALLPESELAGLMLFTSVEYEALAPQLAGCLVRTLVAGDVLIRRGDRNRLLYLLLSGRVAVHIDDAGGEAIVELEAGESVGEMSLIDGQPASADVVAMEPCRVLVVDDELLWLLVDTFHAVSSNLLHLLVRRLRFDNDVIREDREKLAEYRFHATTDGLTGLYNRYWLDRMLPRQVTRARRSAEALSLLLLDVDDFKQYNDQHGHLGGDQALRAVSLALRDMLRPSDMSVRYGGEEFLVLLPGTGLRDGVATGWRLCRGLPRVAITHTNGAPLPPVTVSIGVCELSGEATTEDLIRGADEMLYQAKRDGRNRVCP